MLSTKKDRLLVFKRVLDVIEREYEADELFNQLDDERQEFKNEYIDKYCLNKELDYCNKSCPFKFICFSLDEFFEPEKLKKFINEYKKKIEELEDQIKIDNKTKDKLSADERR